MRQSLVLGVAWLASVAPASAQVSDTIEVAAIVRTDRVSFEANQPALLPVAGMSIAYRFWRDLRIEGEVTTASGESRRSYEGDFFSYSQTTSREEYLRMAVFARRTTVHRPGLGFAAAVAVETREPRRVNLGLRAGV